MKTKVFIPAAIVAAIGLGGAFWYGAASSKSNRPEVKQIVADKGVVVSTVRAPGVVESGKTILITAEVVGVVGETLLRVGQQVREGDPVLRIASDEASSQVRARVVALGEANTLLRQHERLLDALRQDHKAGGEALNAVKDAENRLQIQRSQRDRAQADLDAARIRLKQHELRSPITGTVTEQKVSSGEFVQPGAHLYTLATTDALEIMVKVDLADAPALALGQVVTVSTDGASGKSVQEKVLRIEPSVKRDGSSEYLPVWVSVSGNALGLLPNQQVDVRFTTETLDAAVRLPLEVLVTSNGKDHVWVIQSGHLAMVPVTIGTLGDTMVEIRSGIQAGQAVVMLDGKTFQEGDAVKVAAKDPTP